MTTRFVGKGGSDANSGLTWALRKLTLNGAEDIPVVPGDTVDVGPGTYRETLTVDVSGTSGNPITYIADVTGENTDSVGGIVRITGSDNDTSTTRNNGITATAKDYRTFRGFSFDSFTSNGEGINISNCDDLTIEDCSFFTGIGGWGTVISSTGVNLIIRRCLFLNTYWGGMQITHSTTHDNANDLIENCLFVGGGNFTAIRCDRVGGVTVKNSMFIGNTGVRVQTALTVGQNLTVRNCIFQGLVTGVKATTTAEFDEDYNTFFANGTDRSNVNVGANSLTYPAIYVSPILVDGLKLPWQMGELSQWSQIARIAGNSEATDDLFGITRPATSAKKSWGPIQLREGARETTTTRSSSAASIKLADAGDHQIIIPVTNASTTFEVYVNREANYAGTNPQLIIRQPGVADDVTTDAGAVSTWNQLTTTLTPAANPPYVIAILRSLNTATSGSYATYFDDLAVT